LQHEAVFLVSSGENEISPFFPLESLGKSTSGPIGKNPPDAHVHKHVKLHDFCKKIVKKHTPSNNAVEQP